MVAGSDWINRPFRVATPLPTPNFWMAEYSRGSHRPNPHPRHPHSTTLGFSSWHHINVLQHPLRLESVGGGNNRWVGSLFAQSLLVGRDTGHCPHQTRKILVAGVGGEWRQFVGMAQLVAATGYPHRKAIRSGGGWLGDRPVCLESRRSHRLLHLFIHLGRHYRSDDSRDRSDSGGYHLPQLASPYQRHDFWLGLGIGVADDRNFEFLRTLDDCPRDCQYRPGIGDATCG